ncbi:transcriptional regulator [Paenibacillus sp. J31TS4]|uniref:BlaI/MecI/CopY family transcriptional regulator n=1 Tax=Paenibacillus sp. J31TS4 TaxID=2807195 RepID=UPI001B2B0642|nr:BlaI/MecI/CopY family transcriptional regulator [Paenibacillus sp. J31TS4]GIP38540.1 transcriptional regulator [Paenibacillus sp. J31TS4]
MRINKFNMNEHGLHRFFGSLEVKVMNTLWEKEKLTIKQAHEMINREDPISFNAVMTVMNRLTDKGVLRKESTGGGRNRLTYFYPTQTKEQFISKQTRVVTEELIEDFGPLVVNHFIERLDYADPELIKKLEKKLNEMKNNDEIE